MAETATACAPRARGGEDLDEGGTWAFPPCDRCVVFKAPTGPDREAAGEPAPPDDKTILVDNDCLYRSCADIQPHDERRGTSAARGGLGGAGHGRTVLQ